MGEVGSEAARNLRYVPRGSIEARDCAILFADIAGYSSMMTRDELGTLEFIVGCSHMMHEASARHHGELIQSSGDGYLVLFENALDAVNFGVELHRLIAKRQSGLELPARFRVGIHLGQVHLTDGTAYGHAVNIAARLEAEALPGTCVLSQAVYDHVNGVSDVAFEAIGRPALKNISERIPLYRTLATGEPVPASALITARIAVLGSLTLRAGATEFVFAPSRKSSAVLGYLALVPGMRERTEKLAGLIWPHLESVPARRSVGNCRRQLRAIVEKHSGSLFYAADGDIGLNELQFDTDLALILSELRRGRVPQILLEVTDWPSRILEGFENTNPLFASWLEITRTTWRNRIIHVLTDLIERFAPHDESCHDAALAILAIEPGNEQASTALIEHFAAHGNRMAAIEEFDRLEAYLRARHDLSPGETVLNAIDSARKGGAKRSNGKLANGQGEPPGERARLLHITVEQFVNRAGCEEHLIAGFRSELLANLARFREWSIAEGKGPAPEGAAAPVTSREAGRHYAIYGECSAGPSPTLHLRLQDLSRNRLVWSDTFVLDLSRWADLQRDVVARIAARLDTYISADRIAIAIGNAGYDLTSHDIWLQAENLFARWSPEAAEEAETMLWRLIRQDDRFAPAYSSLASFRNVRHVIRPGERRDAESERVAHGLAERAIEIDPLDARNQLAVAWTAALTGRFDRASIHFDLASTLNPNSVMTQVSAAMGYAFIGQADRGETLVSHVLRISPIVSDYQWCYIAAVHFLAGRYEMAYDAARLSGDRILDNQGWAAAALCRLGRVEEARAAFDRLVERIRPVWAGADALSDEAVFDWFVGAYPIRHDADRKILARSLRAAMTGK